MVGDSVLRPADRGYALRVDVRLIAIGGCKPEPPKIPEKASSEVSRLGRSGTAKAVKRSS